MGGAGRRTQADARRPPCSLMTFSRCLMRETPGSSCAMRKFPASRNPFRPSTAAGTCLVTCASAATSHRAAPRTSALPAVSVGSTSFTATRASRPFSDMMPAHACAAVRREVVAPM